MMSLEGIIAANRNAERQQSLNRATNGAKSSDTKAIATAVRKTRLNLQPKRDASGRLSR